mgnify:CR=1 FL=1
MKTLANFFSEYSVLVPATEYSTLGRHYKLLT